MIPSFGLGILLQQVFAMQLFWLPPSSMHTPHKVGQLPDLIEHMVLPVATLAFGMLAYNLKFIHNIMLEVLPSEYLTTARAKGLIEKLFNWPGVGWLLVRSAQTRDLPVLLAIIMIGSFVVVIANWIADMLYLTVDPRVRLNKSRQ